MPRRPGVAPFQARRLALGYHRGEYLSLAGSLMAMAMKLKAMRKERGWTQPTLAKKAGVSHGYIARLETGRHDLKLSPLAKLARALGVPVGELLG